MNDSKSLYLPGLNGIRAIAALLVVISHIGLNIEKLGFKSSGSVDMAGYGVTMFFVLSGYLISILLFKEHDKNNVINLKKFYIRRILRIWPVYYLTLGTALGIALLSGEKIDYQSLFFCTFLMANVPFVFGGMLNLIGPLWSVGVEEQFYLFWPWLFRWRKQLPYIMVGIIVLFLMLRLVLRLVENGQWYTFVGVTRFHCMAIGGLGAWAVQYKPHLVKKLYHPIIQIFCWSTLAISVYSPFHLFSIIDGELYGLLFLTIIINVSTNPKPILRLEHPILNWLGSISYGIYAYHMFALTFCFYLFQKWVTPHPIYQLAVYVAVIGTTLAIAHLSYRYFEQRFLKKKNLFAVIPSTNKRTKNNIEPNKDSLDDLELTPPTT